MYSCRVYSLGDVISGANDNRIRVDYGALLHLIFGLLLVRYCPISV
jgi:hypothetical protein